LADSAEYFGFYCDREKVRQALSDHAAQTPGLHKVRLLLSADARLEISSEPLPESSALLRIGVSTIKVASTDIMRYHKTTRREVLDTARANRPDCDDVLLLNEHGQLTEGSYHNLVVKLEGRLVTPPLSCGLLPGLLRQELLGQGKIVERILFPVDLKRVEDLWLINSVRGWRRGSIV
ncbi:MAG: aminotransferase class IV, partial [Desulfuromonadaceae bacterium]|nr:aminotransferase class IV [Desulfuromonadaceae bacterium]